MLFTTMDDAAQDDHDHDDDDQDDDAHDDDAYDTNDDTAYKDDNPPNNLQSYSIPRYISVQFIHRK